jgi:hypothetical protein
VLPLFEAPCSSTRDHLREVSCPVAGKASQTRLNYDATRFLQMISEQGGLATARQVLWSDQPSEGFTTLWLRHRLDLTVEAHVLHEEFATLSPKPTGNALVTA